jgi:hypothetical protein
MIPFQGNSVDVFHCQKWGTPGVCSGETNFRTKKQETRNKILVPTNKACTTDFMGCESKNCILNWMGWNIDHF